MGSGPTQRTRSETHAPFPQLYAPLQIARSSIFACASILKVLCRWWLRLQDAGALGHFTARRITPPSGEVCTAEISLVVEDAAFRGHRDAWEVRAPRLPAACRLPCAFLYLLPLWPFAF